MREAAHVTQDAFCQVARAADRRPDVTTPVIVINMGVGGPQAASADIATAALRPQHSTK
jgi:hypothetical protein